MRETWARSLGWEDFPGEGKGYPLQYSWVSLVAQLVKNPPTMQEAWVRSLGWEDFPGEGKGFPLQYFGLENSMDCIAHGVAKSQTRLSNFQKIKTLAMNHLKRIKCFAINLIKEVRRIQ